LYSPHIHEETQTKNIQEPC